MMNDLRSLFEQLRSGSLNEAERKQLSDWLASSFQDEAIEQLMKEHWASIQEEETDQDRTEVERIKNHIHTVVLKDFWSKREKQPKPVLSWLMRVAAVLVLPLLVISGYLYCQLNPGSKENVVMQQITAIPGSRVHFVLPDRSEVWLNSGSTLEFADNFENSKERKVILEGQGYFQVRPDKDRPFLVETDGLTIKALGTAFDVSDYDSDQYIRSTLESGGIVLLDDQEKELISLSPGQQALYRKATKELSVNFINTKLSTSWKDGRLIFRDSPLGDVVKQLERWFNCKIHLTSQLTNTGILYTATIQDETLGEVLKMIEISTNVKQKSKTGRYGYGMNNNQIRAMFAPPPPFH